MVLIATILYLLQIDKMHSSKIKFYQKLSRTLMVQNDPLAFLTHSLRVSIWLLFIPETYKVIACY